MMYRIYDWTRYDWHTSTPMLVGVWVDSDRGSEPFGRYVSVDEAIAALPVGAEWVVI